MIALSFVRSAKDVEDVRTVMHEEGVLLPVIAKIEKPQAIDNLDEIVEAFDGFMVARGDLGVECPLEDVPFLQKRVVEKARRNAKPVIVATQMLESMITQPGAHPGRGVRRRERRARRRRRRDALGRDQRRGVPDRDRAHDGPDHQLDRGATSCTSMAAIDWQPKTRGGVIAKAAAEVADRVGAKFLVAFTQSGDSARRLARYRARDPGAGVHAGGSRCARSCALTWGVETFLDPTRSSTPTRWCARSTSSCSRSAGSRRATSW